MCNTKTAHEREAAKIGTHGDAVIAVTTTPITEAAKVPIYTIHIIHTILVNN